MIERGEHIFHARHRRDIRQRRAQSVLCLPLMNQSKLMGVLYLENNLAPRVFTPARISVLRLVAAQAARVDIDRGRALAPHA